MSMIAPDVAYNHLFDEVHARVFLNKLASRGYEALNEKEASDLLGLGQKLDKADADPAIKAAAAGEGRFGAASSDLDTVLQQRGIDTGVKSAAAQEDDLAIKQAVAHLRGDPDIYNSALSLQAARADVIGQELGIKQAMEKCEKCGKDSGECTC